MAFIFQAQVYMHTKEESGSDRGLKTGMIEKVFCNTWDLSAKIDFPKSTELLMPGESTNCWVSLHYPMPIEQGNQFTARTGKTTLLSGLITELLPDKRIDNFRQLWSLKVDVDD